MVKTLLDDILLSFNKETPRPSAKHLSTSVRYSMQIAFTFLQKPDVQQYLLLLKNHSLPHYQHSLRVGVMFYDLADYSKSGGCIPDATLALAGTMHDCGKDRIPLSVLEKPSRLNSGEAKIMRAHNRIGYLHLKRFGREFPYLSDIVVGHHRYPRGSAARRHEERRELALLEDSGERKSVKRRDLERRKDDAFVRRARELLEITDVYDALSSRRSYKQPFPAYEVRKELLSLFPKDEKLLDYIMEKYPGPQNST